MMPAITWAAILRLAGGAVDIATDIVRAVTNRGCTVDGCPAAVRDVVMPRLTSDATDEMRQAREDARLRIFGPEA